MVGQFLEWLLGPDAKTIVLIIGAIGTILGAVVAALEYIRRRKLDRDLEKLKVQLEQKNLSLSEKQSQTDAWERDVQLREDRLKILRQAIEASEDELWVIHPPAPFPLHQKRLIDRRPIALTIGNLKGGVGKTTLTANLAAYFAKSLGKRVLVIDLDYQGSLSNMMLSAAGISEVTSTVNQVIGGNTSSENFEAIARDLRPALPGTWIVPAYYSLAPLENRILVQWLLNETPGNDARYRLARYIFEGTLRHRFDVVLFDVPPRLTTATINALCASTHLLVPTILDKMSGEAVSTFLHNVKALKGQLNPSLELLGVVGTFTHTEGSLNAVEASTKKKIVEQLSEAWGPGQTVFNRHIPRRMSFTRAAGEGIAYLDDVEVRRWISELGSEIQSKVGL